MESEKQSIQTLKSIMDERNQFPLFVIPNSPSKVANSHFKFAFASSKVSRVGRAFCGETPKHLLSSERMHFIILSFCTLYYNVAKPIHNSYLSHYEWILLLHILTFFFFIYTHLRKLQKIIYCK